MCPVERVGYCSSVAINARPTRAAGDVYAASACTEKGDVAFILEDLFPANVGWQCFRGLGSDWDAREECKRRTKHEFVLGRQAAYDALHKVGFVDQLPSNQSNEPLRLTESFLTSIVGKNADRSPRWPSGFVGSIAHSRHWIIAAAAQSCAVASIGIDSEPIVNGEQAALLKQDIGHAAEWQLLDNIGLPLPATFTLLFSAKEAYYKCWYPLKQRFLDFHDVIARRVELGHKCFDDRLVVGTMALEVDEADAMQLTVRYCITSQDVFTIAAISNCDME